MSSRPDHGREMLLGFQATGTYHLLYSCPSLSETGSLGLTNSWSCSLVSSLGSLFLLLDESPELFCKLTSRLPRCLRGPDQDPCLFVLPSALATPAHCWRVPGLRGSFVSVTHTLGPGGSSWSHVRVSLGRPRSQLASVTVGVWMVPHLTSLRV